MDALRRCVARDRRRPAAAAVLGALGVAALPPVHAVPLLVVSFTGFVRLIHSVSSPWRAAAVGWWFGFAHFIMGVYWIAPAALLLTESTPAAVIGLLGLSAILAIFPALAAFAARLLPLAIAGRVLAFAIAWSASEWLRGNVLSGFPMNIMGTVWAPSLAMIQFTALAGAYGLGFVTVLAAAAPAALSLPPRSGRSWALPAAAFGLLTAVWAGGAVRLAFAPEPPPTGVSLRLVQANIHQRFKWREKRRKAVLDQHVRLSRRPGFEAVDLVIWPEMTVTFNLAGNAPLRARLSRAAPPDGHLLTGSLRRTRKAGRATAVWNSLHALTPGGAIAATYNKHHLVPFGEYMPLREAHSFRVVPYESDDYSAGPGPRTLSLPGVAPFSPLICYEAIFPGEVVASGERPRWLLNITNDAWFEGTSGPWQHFEAARLRAVEEGLPLVRATNTGISAVVDAWGRVTGRLGPGEEGVLDVPLPPPTRAPTPHARFGGWTFAALLLLAASALPAFGLRGRTKEGGPTATKKIVSPPRALV